MQDPPDDVLVQRLGEVTELGEQGLRVEAAAAPARRPSSLGGPTRPARLLHGGARAPQLQEKRGARVVAVRAALRDDQGERPRGLDGEAEAAERLEPRGALAAELAVARSAPHRPPAVTHRAHLRRGVERRRQDVDGHVARVR